MEKITSAFLSLVPKDVIKGAITAALTIIVTALYNAIGLGTIPTDFNFWKTQFMLGLGAGVAYLLKNFLTNSNDQFLKKEDPKV